MCNCTNNISCLQRNLVEVLDRAEFASYFIHKLRELILSNTVFSGVVESMAKQCYPNAYESRTDVIYFLLQLIRAEGSAGEIKHTSMIEYLVEALIKLENALIGSEPYLKRETKKIYIEITEAYSEIKDYCDKQGYEFPDKLFIPYGRKKK